MAGGVKVLSGVFVGRRITAAHVAAAQADTQMDPPIAGLQTIFAALGAGSYFPDLVKVLAIIHPNLQLLQRANGQ